MAYIADEQSKPDLMHYGVKGMQWGVRKDRTEGVSRSTDREARKDAKEYARAKMFYGEGAGTRRKLIYKSVEAKAKRDPSYKKAFDRHLDNQDLSKHASKARSERRRKDTRAGTAKTARGIRNILNGNSQFASLTAVMLVGGAAYAKKMNLHTRAWSEIQKFRRNKNNMRMARDFLNGLGIRT